VHAAIMLCGEIAFVVIKILCGAIAFAILKVDCFEAPEEGGEGRINIPINCNPEELYNHHWADIFVVSNTGTFQTLARFKHWHVSNNGTLSAF